MWRGFMVAAAVALACWAAGCGQAKVSGRRATGTHTSASNRTAATLDARHLVAMVRVPPGSKRNTEPRNTGFEQVARFIGVSASATASRTWIVPAGEGETLRYVVAHLRRGSTLDGTGTGDVESEIRLWPPIKGVLGGRWLQLQAYTDGTDTYLTASSQSQWIVTRPAGERIPPAVTRITITVIDHGHARHRITLSKRRVVQKVVALYNSLGVIQPATIFGCQGLVGTLTVRFYDSARQVVATVSSSAGADQPWPPSVAGWACFPIGVTIGGRRYPSLSGNVVGPLERLVGVRLTS